MEALAIALFGGFAVEVKGVLVSAFESNKVRALLAYLVVEAGARPHHRSALAALLWPDYPEEIARTNLRHVLRQLRQTLPETPGAPLLLLTTQQTIQINPVCPYTLDVARFTHLLTAARRCTHRDLAACPDCLTRYYEAADLYRGDFLAGFSLYDSEPFDEWLVIQREGFHRRALELFFTLAAYHEAQGDYEQAQQYAQRQLALEPWREEAHRQLMRVLAYDGQRNAALAHYAQCRKILADELSIEPDAETVALYEQIRSGKLDKMTARLSSPKSRRQDDKGTDTPLITLSPPHPVTPSPLQDWGEAPQIAYFYGRKDEQAQLQTLLLARGCRLVAVLGMGGIGKTTLVVKTVHSLETAFDCIFWRSLVNAPPLAEVLTPLLQILLPTDTAHLPTDPYEQLALLSTRLAARRCLVVLDNLESILTPNEAGRYRTGYEAYGQLLQRFVHGDHQSCLVVTSRERPTEMAQLEDDLPTVRALLLRGLEAEAGQTLLKIRGLADETNQAAQLVARYSGNPLALKLIARTVQELFDGDIRAFLGDEEAPIFDDIRSVLDQQFARLTEMERDLLVWLAVEREPLPLHEMARNLISPPARGKLIEAVRALQHRSLVEKTEGGFMLQNVVTEYLTDYLVKQVCQEITLRQDFGEISRVVEGLLNRYALSKAQIAEHVRQSQLRQIVQPIVSHLIARLGRPALVARLEQLRATLQAYAAGHAADARGYLGGNVFNLLLHLGVDLSGHDFSHMTLWQAYLRGALLPRLDLTGADLTGASFTYCFDVDVQLLVRTDGELLVYGTRGTLACIWQAGDGTLLHAMPRPGQTPNSLMHVHEDGRTALLADADHTLYLVDLAAGQVCHTLVGHRHTIWRPLFSHGGNMLATSDASGAVLLWDVATGKLRWRLASHATPIYALAFAPDDRLLASGGVDGVVCLWRLATGELVRTFQAHEDETATVQFVVGGTVLATGSHDRTIGLWDVASGELRQRLRGHTKIVRSLATDAAGEILISGGLDEFILVWDAATGEIRRRLTEHKAHLNLLACWRDGQRAVSLDVNETISIWDLHTGRRFHRFTSYRNGVVITFGPDGNLLVCGSQNGTLYLWDISQPAAPRVQTQLRGHTRRIRNVAFNGDGITVASGDLGGELRLWSIVDGSSRILSTQQPGILDLTFSPDQQYLASAGISGVIDLWEVSSGRRVHSLRGHTNNVMACAFSPDGRQLVSCGMDRTVRLWDVARGAPLQVLHGHTNVVNDVCFTPDGRWLISTGYDQVSLVWAVADGQILARWPSGDAPYIALSVHPNGQLIAAGSRDGTVHLLEITTGRRLERLHGHSLLVQEVYFSPTEVGGLQLLASASHDETVKLWRLEVVEDGTGLAVREITCLSTLRTPGPYAGMKIGGVTGISEAQKAALIALGAVEEDKGA